MALYDALQKRLNKAKAPLLAEAGDATAGQTLAGIQAAKGGKAGAAQPQQASLAEQAAAQGAVQDVQQAGSQNDLQARAMRLAEQKDALDTALGEQTLASQLSEGQANLAAGAATQRANVASQEALGMEKLAADSQMQQEGIVSRAEQAIANLVSSRKIEENNLFQQFSQEERELEFRRDAAAIEQMATMMALRDRSYVDEITRIGKLRNLSNELEYAKETARLVLGDETSTYLSKLNWGEQDLIDSLRFEEKLSQLSIDQAWSILKQKIAENNAASVASGATSAVKAGVDYYTEQDEKKKGK